MRKLLLINIIILLALGQATGQTPDEINHYALPEEFFRSPSPWDDRDIPARVNFYLEQSEAREQLHTIALLPANYADKYENHSPNQPGQITPDSLIKMAEKTDSISKSNSRNEPGPHTKISVILNSTKGGYNEYEWWKGKACHDSICDSITKIVESEFLSNGSFKCIPPQITKIKCDSIYQTLDIDGQYLWEPWFYPNRSSDDFPKDEKSIKQISRDVLQCLGAGAYAIIDVSYRSAIKVTFGKRRKYEQKSQMFCKISLFGPGFKVLWSSEFPISKRTKKDKYAYEIIDYKMANKNIKRTLSLLRPNKTSN